MNWCHSAYHCRLATRLSGLLDPGFERSRLPGEIVPDGGAEKPAHEAAKQTAKGKAQENGRRVRRSWCDSVLREHVKAW